MDKMEFVISHLAKSYGKHQVLVDADYAFEEGKIYGLLGRNGSGKTTLFNCLNSDTEIAESISGCRVCMILIPT